jgi:hypothetical protein
VDRDPEQFLRLGVTRDELVFPADATGTDADVGERDVGLIARACQVAAVAVVLAAPGALAGELAALVAGAGNAGEWFAAGGVVGAVFGLLLEADP